MKASTFARAQRVLDVAAGNGNATLAAARRFARVTSTDYVPALLERGRRRAEADGLDVTFEVADAEALPYPDASFDVVLSTFGVMFAPDHDKTRQRDAARVQAGRPHRPGVVDTGRASSASSFAWSAKHVPPTAGRSIAAAVGHRRAPPGAVRGRGVDRAHGPHFAFRYRSPEHFVDVFRTFYGPVHKAFAALDANGQAALEADLIALLRTRDRGGESGLVVPAEYLETVVTTVNTLSD